MIIKKKRISNPDKRLSKSLLGSNIFIGIRITDNIKVKLTNIGFTSSLIVGESIIPKPQGPVSNYNANGKYYKLKDLPKEIWYHELPYSVQDWGGNWHTGVNYIPRERYQTQYIEGSEIRMTINEVDKLSYVVSGPFHVTRGSDIIKNAINLYLEIFGECEILDSQKRSLITHDTIRLDREILPKGEMPRQRMKKELGSWANKNKSKKELFQWRLDEMANYKPSFTAVGRGGFSGYCIFGFEGKKLYVLESMFSGNATYVFDGDRERLSQMTKAQILSANLQKHRIIHRESRKREIAKILGN